jgi:nucleoid-associated protein YgaU
MRKLVLFGLLAGVFGLALALENFFSRQQPAQKSGDDGRVVLQLGGGPPRSIPVEPPVQPVKQDDGRTARAKERPLPDPAPRPADVTGLPGRTHVVARGETLSSIARGELGSSSKWKELALWNGIEDAGALREGTSLRLAPSASASGTSSNSAATEARTHKIAKGETLSRLAARYLGDATRWREIQRLNGITDPASVPEGSTLKIPER